MIDLKRPKALYIEQNKIVLGVLLLKSETMISEDPLQSKSYAAFMISGENSDFYTLARNTERMGGSVLGYRSYGDRAGATMVVPFSYAGEIEKRCKELDMKVYPVDAPQDKTWESILE
jgi:hypothetical protein